MDFESDKKGHNFDDACIDIFENFSLYFTKFELFKKFKESLRLAKSKTPSKQKQNDLSFAESWLDYTMHDTSLTNNLKGSLYDGNKTKSRGKDFFKNNRYDLSNAIKTVDEIALLALQEKNRIIETHW